MGPHFTNTSDDGILQLGGLSVFLKFFYVTRGAFEVQNICAEEAGIHFLEGASFDKRVDPFPGAVSKVVATVHADFQIIIQVFVVKQVSAFRALGPESFWNIQPGGSNGGNFGFTRDTGGCNWRGDCRFNTLHTRYFAGFNAFFHIRPKSCDLRKIIKKNTIIQF